MADHVPADASERWVASEARVLREASEMVTSGATLFGMDLDRLAAGALRGIVGAMSMTGYRTLAAEFGLLGQGTPPERVADEAIPKLMAVVPAPMRPGVVDLLHVGYGAFGGAIYAAIPPRWRRHWASGPAFGMALWLGYNAGIVPLLELHPDRPRRPHEVVVLAGDHVLYGVVIGRLGGRPI